MLERVRCTETKEVLSAAAGAEIKAIENLDINPADIYNSAKFSAWLRQRHELLEHIYAKAVREAKQNPRMAGSLFRGRTFQQYAGIRHQLETWFTSNGTEVVLLENSAQQVLQKLPVESINQFERRPSLRAARKALKSGYKPDGLLVGKRVHPVEYTLGPNDKYISDKEIPFRLAVEEYAMFNRETRVQLIAPSDASFGHFDERMFKRLPTHYDYNTVLTFLREVFHGYRPDPATKTLSERGLNLLTSTSHSQHRRNRSRQSHKFASKPARS